MRTVVFAPRALTPVAVPELAPTDETIVPHG
jgi:hypothetical protein